MMITTPTQKQNRLQIILAVIIGLTLPCYGLGFIFVSVNRQADPTNTPHPPSPTSTRSPQITDTPVLVIPTRFPTFTPTLTGTPTSTSTITPTPTLTPSPTETPTATLTPTLTDTPTETAAPLPTTDTPGG